MLHAHFVNIANPGSYSKTFNDLMRANNLPTLNFPEEPPSLEIITRLSAVGNVTPGSAASSQEANQMEVQVEDQSEKEKEKISITQEQPKKHNPNT